MIDLSNGFVIAEAGTCHAGRLDKAMRYVHAAKEAGADCVKFQMFDDTKLFCPYPGDEQRQARWHASALTLGEWQQVKEFTEACGMMFLASVFQLTTVMMLRSLGVKATKVASRAAKNFPYDKAPAPFLVSDGMFKPHRFNHRLECESVYPSTMCWSGNNKNVGFSDHSGTPWRAIDAISRGCKLVEVHFCIDPLDAGPDLPASLNPDELKLVCEARDAFAELRSDE
jgi:sialic acid synthase SpsE